MPSCQKAKNILCISKQECIYAHTICFLTPDSDESDGFNYATTVELTVK